MSQYLMSSPLTDFTSVQKCKQWSNLRNALMGTGNDVIVVSAIPSLTEPKLSDLGLIFKNNFIRANPSDESVKSFASWITYHEFESPRLSAQPFRGATNAIFNWDKTILWYGIGDSSFEFKKDLDIFFEDHDVTVRGLELIDPEFKRLSKCFCLLNDGWLLWYPEAFSEHSRSIIETWYDGHNIQVTREDALNYACDSIVQSSIIIMPHASPDLIDELNLSGFTVTIVDTLEFGVGCKSLALKIIE